MPHFDHFSRPGEIDPYVYVFWSNINFHPRNQDVYVNMLEMFFSFQCTKYDENRWLNTKLLKNRRNSPKKTISLFCNIVTHSVLLSYTVIGHFRWVKWDLKWPWAPWQRVGMIFQVFTGLSQSYKRHLSVIKCSIQTQCNDHDRGVANAITVGHKANR